MVTTLPPFAASTTVATTINGTTVDTKGYNTAMLHSFVNYLPTGISTTVLTLQESADNATWSNALDNTGTVIGFTIVANANSGPQGQTARIEGLGLNRKRYLRAVAVQTTSTSAVAGTTYAVIALGRAYNEPVRTPVSNT